MDAREEIAALVACERRAPGTDAERRAARHAARRLEQLGREVAIAHVDTWPRWPLAYALHLTLGVVGSVVAVSDPVVGASLVGAAVLLIFLELAQVTAVTRRLLGRRASQNVVSPEDADKPGVIVLVAHVDSGRRALASRPLVRRLWPAPPSALLIVLACVLVRVAGLDSVVLTAIQFVPTAVLIAAIPLLVDISLAPTSSGDNDNASGVAAVLGLAERHGERVEHFDLCVLLTGAGTSLGDGMRSFLRRRRKLLDKQRTVFLVIEAVGSGSVRYATAHPQLLGLCTEIVEDDPGGNAFGAGRVGPRRVGDAAAARAGGFPTLTVTCRDENAAKPDHVDAAALARATAFCGELISRLDAEVGPTLRVPEPTVPAA